MATQYEIQTALANEARRLELKTKAATLKGSIDATGVAVARLSTLNADAMRQHESVLAELTVLEAGSGPGITADFGQKSTVTQFLEAERLAAKTACIAFVKANPECTEAEAADAWDQAAISAHPYIDVAVQSGLAMGRLYAFNLAAAHMIPEATWENQRAWIITTPTEEILAA